MTSQKRKEKQELHTNCPLLTLSRRDCDTAVTHVSVSPQSWKSPPRQLHRSWVYVLSSPHVPYAGLGSAVTGWTGWKDSAWMRVYWVQQRFNRQPYLKTCYLISRWKGDGWVSYRYGSLDPSGKGPHQWLNDTVNGWWSICVGSKRLKVRLLNFMLLGKSFIMTIIPKGRTFRKEKWHFVLLKVI